jgi:hypothetical protein
VSGGKKRRFDAALLEDDQQPRRFDDALSGGDDDGFRPWTGPETLPLENAQMSRPSGLENISDEGYEWLRGGAKGASDAAYSGAHGMFTGLGLNPSGWNDEIAARQLMGQERSPMASTVGGIGGEVLSQAATGMGAIAGGALSGFANTEGDIIEKGKGAVAGGALGKGGELVAGAVASVLQKGADALKRGAMNMGLRRSGATTENLRELDKLGGREYFAENAERMGLTGRPGRVLSRSEELTPYLDQERVALVGPNPPDVDARALGATVRGAADRYPGITPVRNAANRAGRDAESLGMSPGLRDEETWMIRDGMRDMAPFREAYASAPGQTADIAAGRVPTNQGQPFDPIQLGTPSPELADKGIKQTLWDGRHRLQAAREAGAPGILASTDYGTPEVLPLSHQTGAAPWGDVNKQRQYYGDKTNFASGTPEANIRKDIYRGYNEELGDALSLQNPGAGDKWRQYGRDEQVAIEMGDIASGGVDRAAAREPGLFATPARMAGDMLRNPAPAKFASAMMGDAAQGAREFPAGVMGGQAGSELVEAHGNNTTDEALTLLQSNPRELGAYSSKFAEAAASPQRDAVTALINKLIMTDPDFRKNILPKLKAR